jgi:DNA-binding transcriptional regulator YdaS (Cro superfamily)
MSSTEFEALQRAVQIAGGQSGLARAIETSQQRVWKWVNVSHSAPAEMVLAIERATGVPRWQLRPDIYPPEEYAPRDERPAEQGTAA